MAKKINEEIIYITEKTSKFADIANNLAAGLPFVPSITGGLKEGSNFLLKKLRKHNPREVGSCFVMPTNDFFQKTQEAIKSILDNKVIRKKYELALDSYSIEMYDYFADGFEGEKMNEANISYYMFITFNDDTRITPQGETVNCDVNFQFREDFKNINFDDKKVYSAFEITSFSYPPDGKRNYRDLVTHIISCLCDGSYQHDDYKKREALDVQGLHEIMTGLNFINITHFRGNHRTTSVPNPIFFLAAQLCRKPRKLARISSHTFPLFSI